MKTKKVASDNLRNRLTKSKKVKNTNCKDLSLIRNILSVRPVTLLYVSCDLIKKQASSKTGLTAFRRKSTLTIPNIKTKKLNKKERELVRDYRAFHPLCSFIG
jgi:hypothetical protein